MSQHCFALPALETEPALSDLNAFWALRPARRRTLPGCSVAAPHGGPG